MRANTGNQPCSSPLLHGTKQCFPSHFSQYDKREAHSGPFFAAFLLQSLPLSAKGTIVGQNAHQGSNIAFLFMRNLALKALGADVSLSSVITARVVAFDLVSVGDLATVHGPRHLTAVNYGSRRMVLKRVKVGAGAYVGPNCTLEPGCEVRDDNLSVAAGYLWTPLLP